MSALKLLWNFFETTQENKISWKGIYLGKIQFDVSYTVYASSSDWLCFLTYVLDGLECSSIHCTGTKAVTHTERVSYYIDWTWVCTRPVHWLTSSAARLLDWARPTPFTPPHSPTATHCLKSKRAVCKSKLPELPSSEVAQSTIHSVWVFVMSKYIFMICMDCHCVWHNNTK